MLFGIPSGLDFFNANFALMTINVCSVLFAVLGNVKAISQLARKESCFDNLISALALLDVITAVAGNGAVFHHVLRSTNGPKRSEYILNVLNAAGVLNAIVLLMIAGNCWYSVKSVWAQNNGAQHFKITLLASVVSLQQIYTLTKTQYHLQQDVLVCIMSTSFCALNLFLYQILSTLGEASKEDERSLDMVRHQYMTNQLVVKIIHFSFAWVPFLIISKISSVADLYDPSYNKTQIFLWSVTWVFAKGTIDPISTIVFS